MRAVEPVAVGGQRAHLRGEALGLGLGLGSRAADICAATARDGLAHIGERKLQAFAAGSRFGW